jgi:hypothetical protein
VEVLFFRELHANGTMKPLLLKVSEINLSTSLPQPLQPLDDPQRTPPQFYQLQSLFTVLQIGRTFKTLAPRNYQKYGGEIKSVLINNCTSLIATLPFIFQFVAANCHCLSDYNLDPLNRCTLLSLIKDLYSFDGDTYV